MLLKSLVILCLSSTLIYSQIISKFDFAINYNYTNTSKLFLQPKSSDLIVRTTYNELEDIYSFSGEIRFQIFESLYTGLWLEAMEKTFINKNFNLGSISIDINDGYRIIPLELSLYYFLPFSTEKFKFYMGGGFGFYFGKSLRQVENISAINNGANIGYGIQVSVLMEYLIYDFIFLRTQMRFRDPEIELNSKYSSNSFTYKNRTYYIHSQNFTTKVNVDGITFSIGIGFRL
ncbi:MAG: hypothetical protein QHH13_03830 [Melioribacter sp.]|nr:hypothetical protein [Melioribacter sp.]